jgi:hypothetical protein
MKRKNLWDKDIKRKDWITDMRRWKENNESLEVGRKV